MLKMTNRFSARGKLRCVHRRRRKEIPLPYVIRNGMRSGLCDEGCCCRWHGFTGALDHQSAPRPARASVKSELLADLNVNPAIVLAILAVCADAIRGGLTLVQTSAVAER